jgi:trehalose 6-phosphate phosphatase
MTGLQVQSGKMVFELKAPWADKGTALSFLMTERDMAGTRPVFVGDDDTDESAFEAAKRLGGAGILVGPLRQTAAVYGLKDVESTRRWLEAGAGAQ